jgi:hypothetical protein
VTVQDSQGNNPPGNSSQLPGATGVLVQQIVLTNPAPGAVTLTGLTLSQTGGPGITSATLLKNGVPVQTAVFNGGNAVFNFSDTIAGNNGAVTYQVQVNVSNTAGAGNYGFSITNELGTNGQAVLFSPMVVPGATLTVTTATATPSRTATLSPTQTRTATVTETRTSTPQPNSTPVLYPNPVSGPTVDILLPPYTGLENIRVEIFTLSFRKVVDKTYFGVGGGTPVVVVLTGSSGRPLANGIFYVVVTVGGHRSIEKLMILR